MKCYIMIVPSGSGPILGLPFVRAPVSKLQPGTSLFIAAEKALLEQSSVVRSCTLLHQRWVFFLFWRGGFLFLLMSTARGWTCNCYDGCPCQQCRTTFAWEFLNWFRTVWVFSWQHTVESALNFLHVKTRLFLDCKKSAWFHLHASASRPQGALTLCFVKLNRKLEESWVHKKGWLSYGFGVM